MLSTADWQGATQVMPGAPSLGGQGLEHVAVAVDERAQVVLEQCGPAHMTDEDGPPWRSRRRRATRLPRCPSCCPARRHLSRGKAWPVGARAAAGGERDHGRGHECDDSSARNDAPGALERSRRPCKRSRVRLRGPSKARLQAPRPQRAGSPPPRGRRCWPRWNAGEQVASLLHPVDHRPCEW